MPLTGRYQNYAFGNSAPLWVNVETLNGADAAEDLAVTAAAYGTIWRAPDYVAITRFRFFVTEAVVATTTAPIVALNHLDRDASTELEASAALLTIPTGTAIGECKTCHMDTHATYGPILMEVGECLQFEHMQICVGGTITGQGWYAFEYRVISVPQNATVAEDLDAPS